MGFFVSLGFLSLCTYTYMYIYICIHIYIDVYIYTYICIDIDILMDIDIELKSYILSVNLSANSRLAALQKGHFFGL